MEKQEEMATERERRHYSVQSRDTPPDCNLAVTVDGTKSTYIQYSYNASAPHRAVCKLSFDEALSFHLRLRLLEGYMVCTETLITGWHHKVLITYSKQSVTAAGGDVSPSNQSRLWLINAGSAISSACLVAHQQQGKADPTAIYDYQKTFHSTSKPSMSPRSLESSERH